MYKRKRSPHFNEEYAYEAVECMQNEDNTKSPHWSVEESTSIANQLGINLNTGKYNKWDWFVALNMVYSDFYKAVVSITGNANTKHFVELAKAWLCDKDAPEGKMWYYFVNIMCDEEPEEDYYGREARRYREYEPRYRRMMYPKYEEEEYEEPRERRNTSIRYF